jgi:hypothetical protein
MTTYKLRVIERTDDNGIVRLSCIDEGDSSIYTSATTGGTPGGSGSDPLTGLASTLLEVLDIPLLSETDDWPGVYVAAGSVQDNWPGAAIYRSTDGGVTFAEVDVVEQRAVIGYTETALAPWRGGNILDQGSVEVKVHGGTLDSASFAAMLEGANRVLIGDEVLQFQTATLIGTRTYRLSNFIRGQLGTDDEMQTHASGERFVLLNSAIKRISSPTSLMGREVTYRAVTLGNISTAGAEVTLTEEQVALKPLAPIDLSVGYAAATGYTATWKRRTRFAAPWLDESDAPIGERDKRYRVRVAFGPTVATDTETSDETITFGVGTDLTWYVVSVHQISYAVSYGYAAEITI